MNIEPPWLQEARKFDGLTEIPGPKTNPVIAGWLHRLKAWWDGDETAWCGTYIAHCMDAAGFALPKYWMRAKSWAEWGRRMTLPQHGCIAVFERKGGGHVGFVVGQSDSGHLMILGGNQGNKVSIVPIERSRAIAYIWPVGVPLPTNQMLAVLDTQGKTVSTNEA